jgi:hypothetical protein
LQWPPPEPAEAPPLPSFPPQPPPSAEVPGAEQEHTTASSSPTAVPQTSEGEIPSPENNEPSGQGSPPPQSQEDSSAEEESGSDPESSSGEEDNSAPIPGETPTAGDPLDTRPGKLHTISTPNGPEFVVSTDAPFQVGTGLGSPSALPASPPSYSLPVLPATTEIPFRHYVLNGVVVEYTPVRMVSDSRLFLPPKRLPLWVEPVSVGRDYIDLPPGSHAYAPSGGVRTLYFHVAGCSIKRIMFSNGPFWPRDAAGKEDPRFGFVFKTPQRVVSPTPFLWPIVIQYH